MSKLEETKTSILDEMKEEIRNTVRDSIDSLVEAKSKKKGYVKDEEEHDGDDMEEQEDHDDGEDDDDDDGDDDDEDDRRGLEESLSSMLIGAGAGAVGAGAVQAISSLSRYLKRNRLSSSSKDAVSEFQQLAPYIDAIFSDYEFMKVPSSSEAQKMVAQNENVIEQYMSVSRDLDEIIRHGERIMRDSNYDNWNDSLPGQGDMHRGSVEGYITKARQVKDSVDRTIRVLGRV